MGSLFAGLLGGTGAAKSSLFAPQSKYRSNENEVQLNLRVSLAAGGAPKENARSSQLDTDLTTAAPRPSKMTKNGGTLKSQKKGSLKRVSNQDGSGNEELEKSNQVSGNAGSKAPKSAVSKAPKSKAATALDLESEDKQLREKQHKEEDAEAAPSTVPTRTAQEPKSTDPFSDEALGRTVFVGNLPPVITKKPIKKLFDTCGSVESIRLRSLATNPETKMHRRAALLAKELDSTRGSGHAYIVFADEASVGPALELNMTEFEGRHIRVDRAAPSQSRDLKKVSGRKAMEIPEESKVTYDPSRSVFAGNLPRDVEDEEVIRFFSDSSISSELRTTVEAVRVVRDRYTREGKGIAFVLYKTRSAARSATMLDGQKLKGRPIRVTRVKRTEGAGKDQSWQGTKSGVKAKRQQSYTPKLGKTTLKRKAKQLTGKRPAVAARKARQLAMKRR